ncbi:glutamyl-tRNA reductase [Crassaminicella profunda]|uniref:glutamyl-tRNA reductase n=1 Tax=Crassaminicella profunda TaxID=1286698 RepID=UPI001CA62715|nr:glutamyl-tRNA reductase [Crassaminicella profunda]QZY57362.1 glutamyl-tRNA reductase [Crassaminicella profunda]
MEIVVVGINHKNSPLEIREKVSFSKSDLEKAYEMFKKSEYVKEVVILSTCNRSEITAVVTEVDEGIQHLKDFYCDFFHTEKDLLDIHFFMNKSDKAVKHVFQLAAGLESLVLGEDQILGQVRNAHEYALERGCTGKVLNKLYREAVTIAKKIKRETAISQNSLSISSIAVKFIEEIFDDLEDKKVLVIGVGKMSRIAIENLIYKGVKEIYVTNRTVGHAINLSERYEEIRVVKFQERYEMIQKVDIVITSTSAPHYVLKKEEIEKNFYKGNRLCIVDIAVPRDVDPEIKNLEGVSVYELDELKKVSLENMEVRLKAAQDAMEMIIEECVQFENWYNCLPVFPVIEEIQEHSLDILESEIESLMKRLDQASSKDKELIEIVMKSMAKKLIKRPILNLKRAGEDRKGKLYAKIASELFAMNIYGCRKKGRKQNA